MHKSIDHIIETEQLVLKPIAEKNFQRLFEMYSNPNVMKYIYDGKIFSEELAKEKVADFDAHWHQHGFGMWMIYLKSSEKAIGYAGFRYFEDERDQFKNQIELGYIIDEPYWGKGYAKECIKACVDAGINRYHFQCVVATILPENISSINVATHAGLSYAFDADFDNLIHHVYTINYDFID
jgi:ribosomal-protein-alanine N-acetyltransferase